MFLTELFDSTKTLYVHRPLMNGNDIRHWAATQGFHSTIPSDDMHVTVAFSEQPVDWRQFKSQREPLTVRGGSRAVKRFGKGAVVIVFTSPALDQRWETFRAGGASSNYPTYNAHLTVTYTDVDINVEPYFGPLIFGPEEFSPIDVAWDQKIVEEPLIASRAPVGHNAYAD